MKPFDEPFVAIESPRLRGRGWSVFVDELKVPARIGIHAHEHEAPQPIVVDARLGYRCEPSEQGEWIDYDGYCARLASFLSHKPHTRLLETLVAD
ncbi:dihydroneopterin aldolase, partial [Burkholderia sp. WTPI3]